jgi:Fe-S cluster assembly iron-binding protein IscA
MITLTSTASKELSRIIEEENFPSDVYLRISVRGGG